MADELLTATRKGLFTWRRSAGAWTLTEAAFVGDHVPMMLDDPRDGSVYATLFHGHFGSKLHRRDADGTWAEITTPAYPPKPADAPVIIDQMRQKEIPWSLHMIWALEIDPRQDGALWCGTLPGGLFHSTDRGQTWQLVESLWNHPGRAHWMGGGYDLPGIHSICVDPRDPNRVLLAVSCGGAWLTEDGGASWRQCAHGMRADYSPPGQEYEPDGQDVHRLVQCRDQPDLCWAQHHNGIFRSTNGGTQWTELKPANVSAFGFAVAVHPQRGDTAWFVPAIKDEHRIPAHARLIVSRTTDGGQTFDMLTVGLPQQHAYDLVYRHGLALDDTGSRLALGSTTGNLFLSEDAGDHWQTLSHHLPPIYAVRFVRSR